MYRLDGAIKRDPAKRWNLPDKVFFACGACHILAHAFISRYPDQNFKPVWIKPVPGHTGNHIVAVAGNLAFDYHGYSDWTRLQSHMTEKARRWWPGWDYELIDLPLEVLVSESLSKTYEGLWLREPKQFLHDAMPRANDYLDHFKSPSHICAA